MRVTRRRSRSAGFVLATWLVRVVFMLSFVLGTTATAGAAWSAIDPIEEREGEESEDGKIAEALALEAAAARRASPGPDGCRAELDIPGVIAPSHRAPPPPSWQRLRRVPPPDEDELDR